MEKIRRVQQGTTDNLLQVLTAEELRGITSMDCFTLKKDGGFNLTTSTYCWT